MSKKREFLWWVLGCFITILLVYIFNTILFGSADFVDITISACTYTIVSLSFRRCRRVINDKSRHICGNPFEKHCEYLHYTGSKNEEIYGKKLEKECLYCTAGKEIKKIAKISSWYGVTPRWCIKLKHKKY